MNTEAPSLTRSGSLRALHAAYSNYARFKSQGRRVGDAAARVEVDRFMNAASGDRAQQAIRLGRRVYGTPTPDLLAPASVAFSIKENFEAHNPSFEHFFDAVDQHYKTDETYGSIVDLIRQQEESMSRCRPLSPVDRQMFATLRQAFSSIPMEIFLAVFLFANLTEAEREHYVSVDMISADRLFRACVCGSAPQDAAPLCAEVMVARSIGGGDRAPKVDLSPDDLQLARCLGEVVGVPGPDTTQFGSHLGEQVMQEVYDLRCAAMFRLLERSEVEFLVAHAERPSVVELHRKVKSLMPRLQQEVLSPFAIGILQWVQASVERGMLQSCALSGQNF